MTGTVDNIRLLPCPFCGEKPKITVNLSGMYNISCENKDCFIQPQTKPCTKSKEELADIWNLRLEAKDQDQLADWFEK